MIRFYLSLGPNPVKVALMLEELSLPYELIPIDVHTGEQHDPSFVKLNPNAKLPVIVDTDGINGGETVIFDSNAILLYLGDKTGRLIGKPEDRGSLLSWLMFVATGLGPFAGQAAHFQYNAGETIPYAVHRYRSEVGRHLDVVERRLAQSEFIASDDYTLVDIDAWAWIDRIGRILPGDDDPVAMRPALQRWLEGMSGRPAVARARVVGADAPFRREIDEAARRVLYPSQFTAARAR